MFHIPLRDIEETFTKSELVIAASWSIENIGTTDLGGGELDAQFTALAFDDPIDGETVVAYHGYYFKPGEAAGF